MVTCRTQFFPWVTEMDSEQETYEKKGRFEVGSYLCQLLYLSPFTDRQVVEYLEQIYTPSGEEFKKAQTIVVSMDSLRMRPLLLSYIEDLMDADEGLNGPLAIYSHLVSSWLRREVKTLRAMGVNIARSELQSICQGLAYSMIMSGDDSLTKDEIRSRMPLPALKILEPMDVGGRSLLNQKSDGSYRYAHQSIKEYLAFREVLDSSAQLEALPYSELISLFVRDSLSPKELDHTKLSAFRHSLHGANLSRTDLRGADLNGADLSRTDLSAANLSRANLRRANLSEAYLSGADLREADLNGADLGGADLRSANLSEADLSGADLTKVNLSRANLRKVNLSGANPSGANLHKVNLNEANLRWTNLNEADLSGADLLEADLRGAYLIGAVLVEANLNEADLSGADLVEADLLGADLTKANLLGADLTKVLHLNQTELDSASGNATTQIPHYLQRPDYWDKGH